MSVPISCVTTPWKISIYLPDYSVFLPAFFTNNPDTLNFVVPITDEILKYAIIVGHDTEKRIACMKTIDGDAELCFTADEDGHLGIYTSDDSYLGFAPTVLLDNDFRAESRAAIERVGRIQLKFHTWKPGPPRPPTPLNEEILTRLDAVKSTSAVGLIEEHKEKKCDFSTVFVGRRPELVARKDLEKSSAISRVYSEVLFVANICYASAKNFTLRAILPENLRFLNGMTAKQWADYWKATQHKRKADAAATAADEEAKKKKALLSSASSMTQSTRHASDEQNGL